MEKLTFQEEEMMKLIWKTGGGFIRDFLKIRPENEKKLLYTTAASIVRNLETKGYIKGEKLGNMLYFKPIISLKKYRKASFKNLVKDYFNGSYTNLVAAFIKEESLSPEELQEIINLIEKEQ